MPNDPSAFFRDMIGHWEKMANEFGAQALKSNEFTQSMNSANAATMTMQSAFQQGMERALAASNLPTRTDIEDLSARVAKIEEALFRIEEKIGSARAKPDKPKPTRGRKPPAEK